MKFGKGALGYKRKERAASKTNVTCLHVDKILSFLRKDRFPVLKRSKITTFTFWETCPLGLIITGPFKIVLMLNLCPHTEHFSNSLNLANRYSQREKKRVKMNNRRKGRINEKTLSLVRRRHYLAGNRPRWVYIRGSQTRVVFVPWETSATSGDILDCHNWKRRNAPGT